MHIYNIICIIIIIIVIIIITITIIVIIIYIYSSYLLYSIHCTIWGCPTMAYTPEQPFVQMNK